MATTPCPRCAAAVPLPDAEEGRCPECALEVRFVEVPERPCARCGAAVPLVPGRELVRCPSCGRGHARSPGRPLAGRTRCPRCRRRLEVGLDDEEGRCVHCGQAFRLHDGPL